MSCKPKKKNSDAKKSDTVGKTLDITLPGLVAEKYPDEVLTTDDWVLEGVSPDLKETYISIARKAPFVRPIIVLSNDTTKYNVWNRYDFYPASNGNYSILYSKNKYIEKTANGWSKVKSLGPMFERDDWGIMRMSLSFCTTSLWQRS